MLSTGDPAVHAEQVPAAPVRRADERVGPNGSIGAALTRWVGSMWAVYVTLAITGTWMALATWGPLRRADPYPFPFMLFLGNLVQILLCFVIMVGQSVLGVAADHRALQTYLNAQAIFERVSEVQAHLDRHDRLLSRGISLLESRPHPWIEQHRVERPPQAKDQVVTLNERFAAWITQRVGTMWAFYAAAAVQLLWMGLWAIGAQRFDPYPFAFLLFVSSLIQLVLMLVIMVGQEVLGRAADGRSEQTFLDAQAILYECERLKARLTKQDRIIGILCNYTSSQVIERLARVIHEAYIEAAAQRGEELGSRPSLRSWDELPEELREANRAQARQIGEKLAEVGCIMVPAFDPSLASGFDGEGELLRLAMKEHERWMEERIAQGYEYGPVREGRFHPDLVPWEMLSDVAREKDVQAVRNIPALLATVGFHVLSVAEPGGDTA